MANWCENILFVEGDISQIKKFKRDARYVDKKEDIDEAISFESLLPVPKRLKDVEKISKWCNKVWGTWRGIWHGELLSASEITLIYRFYSAWDAPIEGIKNISQKYKKLIFKLHYNEPGMGMCGYVEFDNGEILTQISN